jgi:hypothetical protein
VKRKPNQINTSSCSEAYNSRPGGKTAGSIFSLFRLFSRLSPGFIVVLAKRRDYFRPREKTTNMPENTCLHVADTNDPANESGFSVALCISRVRSSLNAVKRGHKVGMVILGTTISN